MWLCNFTQVKKRKRKKICARTLPWKQKTYLWKNPSVSPIPNPSTSSRSCQKEPKEKQLRSWHLPCLCLLRKGRMSKWSCLGYVTAAHMWAFLSPTELSLCPSHSCLPDWYQMWFQPAGSYAVISCLFTSICLGTGALHSLPGPGRHCCLGHGHSPSSARAVRVLCQKSINKHTHTKVKRFLPVECSKALKEISWVPTD